MAKQQNAFLPVSNELLSKTKIGTLATFGDFVPSSSNPTYPVLLRINNDPVSRARRRMEDEESVNSDTTLELHLSDGQFNARASSLVWISVKMRCSRRPPGAERQWQRGGPGALPHPEQAAAARRHGHRLRGRRGLPRQRQQPQRYRLPLRWDLHHVFVSFLFSRLKMFQTRQNLLTPNPQTPAQTPRIRIKVPISVESSKNVLNSPSVSDLTNVILENVYQKPNSWNWKLCINEYFFRLILLTWRQHGTKII